MYVQRNIEVLGVSSVLDSSQIPTPFNTQTAVFHNFKALNTKRRLLYLKIQFVPRCCAMY